MKIKDPTDPTKEIEVFTADEVAEKIRVDAARAATEASNAAIEQYKRENPDKSGELEKMKTDLAEATAKLETAMGYEDGSPERKAQIDRLRKERDDQTMLLNTKIAELTTQITSIQNNQTQTAKAALLDRFAGKDVEARKKVELEFDRYRPNETTPEAMVERMEKAAQISGVATPEGPGAMDGGFGGDGRGDGNYGGNGIKKPTDNSVSIGKALGVTEQELATHIEQKAAGTIK